MTERGFDCEIYEWQINKSQERASLQSEYSSLPLSGSSSGGEGGVVVVVVDSGDVLDDLPTIDVTPVIKPAIFIASPTMPMKPGMNGISERSRQRDEVLRERARSTYRRMLA